MSHLTTISSKAAFEAVDSWSRWCWICFQQQIHFEDVLTFQECFRKYVEIQKSSRKLIWKVGNMKTCWNHHAVAHLPSSSLPPWNLEVSKVLHCLVDFNICTFLRLEMLTYNHPLNVVTCGFYFEKKVNVSKCVGQAKDSIWEGFIKLPVVPHEAVAEVSRRGKL